MKIIINMEFENRVYVLLAPKKFLMYLAALKGIEKLVANEKIKELLKLVALEEVADKKMK